MKSKAQLSQACSDRKKSPSEFDNKIVNCSHLTTIFHWNWKEKLRFVGGLVVHLQKFPRLHFVFRQSKAMLPMYVAIRYYLFITHTIWLIKYTVLVVSEAKVSQIWVALYEFCLKNISLSAILCNKYCYASALSSLRRFSGKLFIYKWWKQLFSIVPLNGPLSSLMCAWSQCIFGNKK